MIIVNEKLAFMLIPKNASSSLRHYYGCKYTSSGEYVDDLLVMNYDSGVKRVCRFEHDLSGEKVRNEHIDLQTIASQTLISDNTRVIAVIRCPIERQLSLYFYRHKHKKQQRYQTTELSVSDFRNRMREGFLLDDFSWQMRLQTWFTKHETKQTEYWLYEDVNEKFKEFGDLGTHNISTKYNTKDLIDVFYDTETLKATRKYWEEDIGLYESLKR
jgi:hypothetical protein